MCIRDRYKAERRGTWVHSLSGSRRVDIVAWDHSYTDSSISSISRINIGVFNRDLYIGRSLDSRGPKRRLPRSADFRRSRHLVWFRRSSSVEPKFLIGTDVRRVLSVLKRLFLSLSTVRKGVLYCPDSASSLNYKGSASLNGGYQLTCVCVKTTIHSWSKVTQLILSYVNIYN